MCNKNKRFRPTLGQYRELEREIEELRMKCNVDGCYDKKLEAERDELKAKLEEQIDGTSVLVQDCDGWRDLYNRLLGKEKELRHSLSVKEEEILKLTNEREKLKSRNKDLSERLQEMESRGFWARVFNK